MTKESDGEREQGRGRQASEVIGEIFTEAIREAIPGEGEERALLADLQRELRGFLRTFDSHPEWVWSPATVRFVRAVRPKLELLGGPVGPQDAGREYAAPAAAGGRDGVNGPGAA